MSSHRYKLRILYLALCALQLVVICMGLAVAFQVLRSYSDDIRYETSLNAARRALGELGALARSASPQTLAVDGGTSGPSHLSELGYAAKLFLPKAQVLLDEAARRTNSPLARSRAHLQELIDQMTTVSQQTRLIAEAWAQHDDALARARLTYLDRAATRTQEILGDIDQDILRAKDDALIQEDIQARRTRIILLPISVVGALLLFPALLYGRHLDHKILAYEQELEEERKLLEERVAARTSALRMEMDRRKRMEAFNVKRNRLLEQLAEGTNLHEILVQLGRAVELSITGSQCIILLNGESVGEAISPSGSSELAAYLETILLRSWDAASREDAAAQAVFFSDKDADAKIRFRDVWDRGYHGILAVPVTDPEQPLRGMVTLLLPESGHPDGLTREVALSASRMASVALKNNRMQDELFRRAHQDSLTALPNRALFQDRLDQVLARAGRGEGKVGVICLDLDDFKDVNDRYGHEAGDRLLQEAAQRLTSFIRKADTVARIGGDEFVAAIADIRQPRDLEKISRSLVRLLGQPYSFGGVTFRTTASVGAALFPADGGSGEELRRNADLAMYRSKELGGNMYQMFSADLGEKLARRRQIEQHLQEALEKQGFELHYQPIYLISGQLAALEALIRFRSAELKSISPAEFMLVAEQAGQISSIGQWVLREACRQGRHWQKHGFAPVPIAVNVSAIQLGHSEFAGCVRQILAETGLQPASLHIEVTETAVMSNFEEGRRQLHALADMGIEISIDDFGIGHSSLSYLHCLPIKSLKIDRSFVQRMVDPQESKAIVRAIIAMARSLELGVVAEGVETPEQLRAVAAAGCGMAQGYYFSKPLDSHAIASLLDPAHSALEMNELINRT